MLSRLIAFLRRVPAVKWAFSRLSPSPHSGSIDIAPAAADDSAAVLIDTVETAPADTPGSDATHNDTDIASHDSVGAESTAIAAIAGSPPVAQPDASIDDASSQAKSAVAEAAIASGDVESAPIDAPEIVIDDAPSPVLGADVAPLIAEEIAFSSDVVESAQVSDIDADDESSREEPAVAEATIVSDDVEGAPMDAPEIVIDSAPSPDLAADVTPLVAEEIAFSSDVVESAPVLDIDADDDSSQERAVAEAAISSGDVESAPIDAPEIVIDGRESLDLPSDVTPLVAEEAALSSPLIENAPVEVSELVVSDDPCPGATADPEAVVAAEPSLPLISEAPAIEASDISESSVPLPTAETDVEPIPSQDPALAAAASTEDTQVITASNEQASVPVRAAPKPHSAPKPRARAPEPADRATLIRRRWAETGIRMWNPRIHGAGDATLNIQGRIELLPPAPGETMPRYDRLEFTLLGGQIVCEGVVVEAPAPASHRSFTRLAEPRNQDRVREPVRERQAALA